MDSNKNPRMTPEQETNARLTLVYEAATPEDREQVNSLIRRAVGAARLVDVLTFTPGMAALLFHDHNSQNRKWIYATTLDYERQMRSGDWEFTNNAIGFNATGPMIDGQHRLAAVALSGVSMVFAVAFGLDLKAVEVIDTGRRREAATAIHILQHKDMPEASLKADVVRKADIFIAKAGHRKALLQTTREIGQYLSLHETLLNDAITLGKVASATIAKPTLKLREAQVVAFALLISGWPQSTVAEHLGLYQTGQDVGESSPFFVAAKILEKETRGERYSLTAKMALTVRAFQLADQGVTAVKVSSLREAMKPKHFPDPTYAGTAAA
jgi:hypothetical protein